MPGSNMAARNCKPLHGSSASLFAIPPISFNIPSVLSKTHPAHKPTAVESQSTMYSVNTSPKPGTRYPPAFSTGTHSQVNMKVKPLTNTRLLSVQQSPKARNINNPNQKQLFATNLANSTAAKPIKRLLPPTNPVRKTIPIPLPVATCVRNNNINKINKIVAPIISSSNQNNVEKRTIRSTSLESNATTGASTSSSNCNSEEEDDDDAVSLSDLLGLDMDDADCGDCLDLSDFDMDAFMSFNRDAPESDESSGSGASSECEDMDRRSVSPQNSPFPIPSNPIVTTKVHSSASFIAPAIVEPCLRTHDTNTQTFPLSTPEAAVAQQVQNVPSSRALSPSISTTSGYSATSQQSDVSVEMKMEGLGQLHYQCSRCLIIYSTLDQMEKHIGQFHMSIRSVDDAPFELNDDNIHTLVKLVWDANLNYNFYTGFVRKFSFSEPNLYGGSSSPPPMTQPQQQPMHFDYGKTTPIPVCINGTQTHLPVLTSSLTGGSQLATDLRGFLEPMRPSINSSVSSNLMNSTILPGPLMDLALEMDMDSDDSESLWDCTSPNSPSSAESPSSIHSFALSHLSPEMRIEMEMPARLPEPKFPLLGYMDDDEYSDDDDEDNGFFMSSSKNNYSKTTKSKKSTKRLDIVPRKMSKKKPGPKPHQKTKSTLKDASRKVSEMMTFLDHMAKDKAEKKKQKAAAAKKKQTQNVPRTPDVNAIGGAQGGQLPAEHVGKILPPRASAGKGKGKKNMRKCRGVYGINNQMNWCNMCKWKKRCSRFGDEEEEEGVTGEKTESEVAE